MNCISCLPLLSKCRHERGEINDERNAKGDGMNQSPPGTMQILNKSERLLVTLAYKCDIC